MAALFRGSRNLLLRWNKHVDFAFASTRSMASKTPVGFIGLGNMGTPMAKNLLRNGYPVIATDVFPESCKELQDTGAQVVDSPADVAEKADRIITMLPSSPNVIEVYTGPNGILKKVKKGTLLIDSSTIDPAVSREMAVAAEKMGAVFMDAPVSGGVGAASMAKLTFMVGGVEEEYNAAQELLTCMGANVVYCGQVGTGQTGFGPQAAGEDPQYVLRSLLVQRHVQPCPRSDGGSPLCQQLPGRLWNHTNGQGSWFGPKHCYQH
uniref:6-phosphogluconate dehydrogenase NADP-binding domain-containing protein n=1 Tax=Amphiprion ocellaris TaxID=80972 RepID=A0AAQ5Z4Y4_AMPOC